MGSSFVIVIKLKKSVSCNRVIQVVNYLVCFYQAGFPRSGKRSGIIFSIPDLEKVGKNDFFQ